MERELLVTGIGGQGVQLAGQSPGPPQPSKVAA